MRRVSVLVLVVLASVSAAFAQNVLQNATFDTGISPWVQESGAVTFDGAVGQPPGSMQLVPPAAATALGRSECIVADAGGLPFTLSGDFLVDTTNSRIVLSAVFFDNDVCSFASGADALSTNNFVLGPGTWFSKSTSGTVPAGTQSLLVDITVSRNPDAVVAHADNIVLDIDLPEVMAEPVPLFGRFGAALLIGLTAAAALAVLLKKA